MLSSRRVRLIVVFVLITLIIWIYQNWNDNHKQQQPYYIPSGLPWKETHRIIYLMLASYIRENFMNRKIHNVNLMKLELHRSIKEMTVSGRTQNDDYMTKTDIQQHRRLQQLAPPKKRRTYILVMGLPRSGSDAIHEYFSCHNVPSAHYCCYKNKTEGQQSSSYLFSYSTTTTTMDERSIRFPCTGSSITCGKCFYRNIRNGNLPFTRCTSATPISSIQVYSQFDVETGQPFSWFLPQHFAIPLLYDSYKTNSVWILNYRANATVWATNVLHWHSVTKRLLRAFDIEYDSMVPQDEIIFAPKHDLLQSDLENELEKSYRRAYNQTEHERRKNALIDIYNKHIEKVKFYAKEYQMPLLEINVDDPDIENKMTNFFLPRNPLSNHNKQNNQVCWKFNATKLDNDYLDFTSLYPRQ